MKRKTIAVYGGNWESKLSDRYAFRLVCELVGRRLAKRGITMVTGGAAQGHAGIAADGAINAGGKVVGVVPKGSFKIEEIHDKVKIVWTGSFHERMMYYYQNADGFIALPGGIGTMHEILDVASISRCGIDNCPILFVDPNSYWEGLFDQIIKIRQNGWLDDSYDQFSYHVIKNMVPIDFDKDFDKWLDSHDFI